LTHISGQSPDRGPDHNNALYFLRRKARVPQAQILNLAISTLSDAHRQKISFNDRTKTRI